MSCEKKISKVSLNTKFLLRSVVRLKLNFPSPFSLSYEVFNGTRDFRKDSENEEKFPLWGPREVFSFVSDFYLVRFLHTVYIV